jgi:type IX secretion system PorP/SprF family membrane protein
MIKYMKKSSVVKVFIVSMMLLYGVQNEVKAQFDAMFTQYMNNEMFINPAYAGSCGALSVTALHRQQWVGFKGAPMTTTLTAHTPLMRNKMGIGLSVLNEKIGVSNRNVIYATYAYRLQVTEKAWLSFGLSAGVHLQLERLSDIETDVSNDPNFSANTPLVATPNFGFGIYFNTDKFYAGFSIPRMVDDHLKVDANMDVLKRTSIKVKNWHYYATVGRLFTVNSFFKLKPQVMIKAVANAPLEFDLNLNTLIKEMFWIGASYRSSADISILAGVQINPQFLISYSYDYPLTKLQKATSGSHELVLSYLFAFKGKKIVTPRYF